LFFLHFALSSRRLSSASERKKCSKEARGDNNAINILSLDSGGGIIRGLRASGNVMIRALRLHEDEQQRNERAKTRKNRGRKEVEEVNEQSFAAHVAKT
jgi:hypothetical protein